jgi:dienelactone hydrolase
VKKVPEVIAPFFVAPKEYAGKMGAFRPLLKFDDGRAVKTKEDWAKRRVEIREYWEKKLGKWPELLERPKVEFLKKETVENFTRHTIKIELAEGLVKQAYLLVPEGKGPFPAIVAVFYDAESAAGLPGKVNVAPFGADMAKRGFVALCIAAPDADISRPADHFPIQPLSYLAYVAANAHTALAQMKEVDGERIGVVGFSFGGRWAMFASCLYDKFAAGVWSDGGVVFDEKQMNANYWEPWFLGAEKDVRRKPGAPSKDNPRRGAYKDLFEEGHDLHELHALMAPRPFLVDGGSYDKADRWVALNHTIALNKLLGFDNRVAMTLRERHGPDEESRERICAFFEWALGGK